MKPDVSVVICVRNVEKYIGNCIRSILDQTFQDFEVVIVDDLSNDGTGNFIKKLGDKRIKYLRNERWSGIARSRNRGLKFATGEYIFFTDGDCVVSKDWIEQGLKFLKDPDSVGVEGKIYYVSPDYKPTFSDHVMQNIHGDRFMTGNMAYKKGIIEKVGGFDERYTYLEDRDLGLRAIKLGKIHFNPKMIVYHPRYTVKPTQYIQWSERIRNRVLLYKRFGERLLILWRIVLPLNLMATIFPPLILGSFFRNRYKTREDFVLFPFIYIKLICERLNIWDMCARERVFLI